MSGKPWHKADPAAFAGLQDLLEQEFPDLQLAERGEQIVLTGEYLITEKGRVLDRYQIEVLVPRAGPRSDIPEVREIGGRIPWRADHHVFKGGRACLFVPDEFWYHHPNGMDLVEFLKGPVLGFFVGQSLIERGQPWPYGERSHGGKGVDEFYRTVVGTDRPACIKAYLEMLTVKKVRHGWKCPCGSNRKIGECHLRLVRDLRERIPRRVAQSSLNQFVG